MNAEEARKAADSVYRYVERTAIRTPGACRWPTLDYENQPRTDLACVFNGAAGIALFLTDYAATANHPSALEMAGDALRWSESTGTGIGPSLCFGRAGIGWGWLQWWRAAGTPEGLDRALALGRECAEHATDPGEWGTCTDMIGGVAGTAEFLLALAAATNDDIWLERAVGLGEWLDRVKVETESGTAWTMRVDRDDKRVFWGAAHGSAGIVRFLAGLYRATRDGRWRALAEEAGVALERAGVGIHGGLNWPRGPGMPELKSQWCHGAPGVGLAFTALFEATNDQRWLGVAGRAGRATLGYGDLRKNPSWCHGVAGNTEILVELFRLTGDERWMKDALAFGGLALRYRMDDGTGDTWQGDEPGKPSPDFMCGASGAGHVFLRLATESRLPMALP